MDRERWNALSGHIRSTLLKRSRDPDLFYEADWEAKEIGIANKANDESAWVSFHMESEYENRAPRKLAERMVSRGLDG